jgi:hypothetical protein
MLRKPQMVPSAEPQRRSSWENPQEHFLRPKLQPNVIDALEAHGLYWTHVDDVHPDMEGDPGEVGERKDQDDAAHYGPHPGALCTKRTHVEHRNIHVLQRMLLQAAATAQHAPRHDLEGRPRTT